MIKSNLYILIFSGENMSKTGISVKMNLQDAKQILREFSQNESYLKNIIEQYIPRDTREDVSMMDYARLKRYGYVIHGVAKKEVSTHNQSLEKKAGAVQLSLF